LGERRVRNAKVVGSTPIVSTKILASGNRRTGALGQVAEGKVPFETQMILNYKAAIEFRVESAEEIDLTPMTLRNLHALLSDNLLPGRLWPAAHRPGGHRRLGL
jgi:hypothetical protein